jgi:tetratricopeptide (TPR) repeat protein
MSRSKVKNLLLLKQIHSAVSYIKKGKLDKALETLDKAEKSARKEKSTDTLYYILFTRGGILFTASKYDAALETYEKTLEAGTELLKTDPENPDYQHYMGTTLSNTGNLLREKGENDRAADCYTRAREMYINLVARNPENAVFRSYAADNLNNYAAFLIITGSFERACEILKESVEIYEKLFEEKPENVGYQAELSVALSQLGSCLIELDPEKKDTAKQNLDKALVLQESLLTQQPDNEKIKDAISLTRKRLESLNKS